MLDRTIVFDIETAPGYEKLSHLPEQLAEHWRKKVDREGEMTVQELDDSWKQAGIYPEFGVIVCISVGIKGPNGVRTKSFVGFEKDILRDFSELLNKNYSPSRHVIAGHNIKGFDIPWVVTRLVIHGMEIPKMLDIRGKKPWQMEFVYDSMEQWALGRWKANVSLDLICFLLGVPSPKDKMDGSEVGDKFYQGAIDEIAEYCEKDVASNFKVIEILC